MTEMTGGIRWRIDSGTYLLWKKVFSDMSGRSEASAPAGMSDDNFINFLVREKIAPYYYFKCNGQGNIGDRTFLKQELERYYYQFVAANLLFRKEAIEVLKILNNEGLKPILFKGLQLQKELYPLPELRPTSDLDLVVRRDEDFGHAMELLENMGYEKFSYRSDGYARNILKEIVFMPPAGRKIMVELHHSLRYGKWDKRKDFDEPFLNDENIHDCEDNGAEYRAMNDNLNYLFLNYHAFESHIGMNKILWINDLRLLKDKTDTDIERLAEATDTMRSYRFGLRLQKDMSGEESPVHCFVEDGYTAEMAAGAKIAAEFANVDGICRKVMWLKWFLFPDVDYLRKKYGAAGRSFLLIYFKHFTGILKGLLRMGKVHE